MPLFNTEIMLLSKGAGSKFPFVELLSSCITGTVKTAMDTMGMNGQVLFSKVYFQNRPW